MLRLTKRRREIVSEKWCDLANLAVAALVFGQALGVDGFSFSVASIGITIWVVLTAGAYALMGDGR